MNSLATLDFSLRRECVWSVTLLVFLATVKLQQTVCLVSTVLF